MDNTYVFESTDEGVQELLPYLTRPGFEDIDDTSIEMSGLAELAEFIASDDTILRLSEVTGSGSGAEDDFVAGCGEWFSCDGVVQAYDSLTTPPLISSTMLEPGRALSPSDSTMSELIEDPLVGGAPADWMDSTLLLDADLDATTVLLGATTRWESFSLDAYTERLMDGVLESTIVWDSMTLDASTERLLDAGPACAVQHQQRSSTGESSTADATTDRMLDALAEPASKYSRLPNVVFSANNNNRLLKCTFIGLGSGCNFVSDGFNPNSAFDYTRHFFNTESFNTIPIRDIVVVAGILSRMAENLLEDLPGAPAVVLKYGISYTQLAGRKVELKHRDASLVLIEVEIKQFVGISEYLVSEDRRVVESMTGEDHIWHRYMMFLDNVRVFRRPRWTTRYF